MAYGLTVDGFVPKRLEDCKADLEKAFRDAYGVVDVSPESLVGQWIGIHARLLTELWEQLENVYSAQYPNTAQGISLDNIVQLNGITRKPATPSSVTMALMTTEFTTPPVIPQWDGSSGAQFQLVGTDTIVNLAEDVTIVRTSAQKVVLEVTSSDRTSYSVEIDGITKTHTTGGGDTEAEIAAGLKIAIDGDATLSTYLDTAVEGAVLTVQHKEPGDPGNTFSLDDNFTTPPSSPSEVELVEVWTPGPGIADEAGATPIPANSATQIVNSITGLDAADNLSAGVTGTDIESDADLRARRIASTQTAGGATLEAIREAIEEVEGTTLAKVFENDGDVIDAVGRPPHSLELVVDGPKTTEWEQDVGDELFRVKPAGIQTFGDEEVTVTDSNGDPQTVRFNYPDRIDIHIVAICTESTDPGDTRPADWQDQVEQNLIDYFSTLELGQDVVYQKLFAPIMEVPGIASVDLRIKEGSTPGPGDKSNIAIETNEVAVTEAANIDVQDAP